MLRLRTVTSTQTAAVNLPLGSIVVADHQTEGRGRLGRTWEGTTGSGLYATFVVPPSPLLLFACGVACAEACGPATRLKWPNDLMFEGRKLGGMLAEVRGDRALVGIGINLSWAPPGAAMLGEGRDALLTRLTPLIDFWRAAAPPAILSRWRTLSWTLGQLVRVDLAGETIEGLAEDIADDGALLVAGRRIVVGDVTRLRQGG